MTPTTVGVIGAGTMGNGIAQVFAQAGLDVRLYDAAPSAIDRARTTIAKSLAKFVEKGKLTVEAREAAIARIHPAPSLDALAEVDWVVEAIVENLALKRELFATLDRVTRPEAILTSNTSSISITTLGASTKRAPQVLGMHFMNPVPLMTLVELVRGQATSDASMQAAAALSNARQGGAGGAGAGGAGAWCGGDAAASAAAPAMLVLVLVVWGSTKGWAARMRRKPAVLSALPHAAAHVFFFFFC